MPTFNESTRESPRRFYSAFTTQTPHLSTPRLTNMSALPRSLYTPLLSTPRLTNTQHSQVLLIIIDYIHPLNTPQSIYPHLPFLWDPKSLDWVRFLFLFLFFFFFGICSRNRCPWLPPVLNLLIFTSSSTSISLCFVLLFFWGHALRLDGLGERKKERKKDFFDLLQWQYGCVIDLVGFFVSRCNGVVER